MRYRPLIPDWRRRHIVRALDSIDLLPNLAPLSPEPGDTGQMLDLKRRAASGGALPTD